MSRDIFGFKRNPQRNFLPDKPKRNFPRVRQTIPRDALAQAVNPAPSRRRFFGFTDDPDAPVSQPYIVSGAAFAAQSGSPEDAFDEAGVGGLLTSLANQPNDPAPSSGGSNIGSGGGGLGSSGLQGSVKQRKRRPKRGFRRASGRDECGFVNACGCA